MRKARPWAAVLVVSVFLSACGDDDDPSGPGFSAETAEQTADAAEQVVAPLEKSAELGANLWNVYGTLYFYGSGVVSPMLPFDAAGALSRAVPGERPSLRGLTLSASTSPQAVLLPEEMLGTTFEWDVSELNYVPSTTAGAPANGVRFVYYAVDPFTGYPAEPLNALGYIQLVDAGTETTPRLEIRAVRSAGSVTLADYFVQAAITNQGTTVTIDSEGYVTDGSDRVDFDLQFGIEETMTTVSQTSSVSIENAGANASVLLDFSSVSTDTDSEEEGTFTVKHDGSEAVFDFAGTYDHDTEVYAMDGSLRYNGEQVVIFEGDGDEPVFTRPDGGPLGSAEIDALVRVWYAFGMTQMFAGEIILPFYFLLVFSGI